MSESGQQAVLFNPDCFKQSQRALITQLVIVIQTGLIRTVCCVGTGSDQERLVTELFLHNRFGLMMLQAVMSVSFATSSYVVFQPHRTCCLELLRVRMHVVKSQTGILRIHTQQSIGHVCRNTSCTLR